MTEAEFPFPIAVKFLFADHPPGAHFDGTRVIRPSTFINSEG